MKNENKPILLLAENKDYLANVIDEYLSGDFQIIHTNDGERAIELMADADICIISLNVRDKAQSKSTHFVRKLKAVKDIPMVILTSMLSSKIRIDLFNEGVDDVVTKPFNPEELRLRTLRFVRK